MSRMSDPEYKAGMDRSVLLARLAADGPDPGPVIEEIEHSEAVGPLFQPTAFLKPGTWENLRWQKDLAIAFAAFRREAMRVIEEARRYKAAHET